MRIWPGQNLSCPKAITVRMGVWLSQSWYLTSLDLCQWLCEKNTWETLGPIAGIAAPAIVYFVNPHNRLKWQNEEHSQVNSYSKGIFSGFSPRGSAPILPTLHHGAETAKKTDLMSHTRATAMEKTPPQQDNDNNRAKRRPHSAQCRLWSPHHSQLLPRG